MTETPKPQTDDPGSYDRWQALSDGADIVEGAVRSSSAERLLTVLHEYMAATQTDFACLRHPSQEFEVYALNRMAYWVQCAIGRLAREFEQRPLYVVHREKCGGDCLNTDETGFRERKTELARELREWAGRLAKEARSPAAGTRCEAEAQIGAVLSEIEDEIPF